MSIAAPVPICGASGSVNSGVANATTLTTAAAVGDLIIIWLGSATTNAGFTGCVDSVGNIYTIVQDPAQANSSTAPLGWCFSQFAMPIGTSITATTTAGQWNFDGIWKCVALSGLSVSDVALHGTIAANSTGTSQQTGLLNYTSEIIFAIAGTLDSVTYTESAGFTNLTGAGAGSNGGIGYQIVTTAASKTWAPTWTTSAYPVNWVLASFAVGPIGLPLVLGANGTANSGVAAGQASTTAAPPGSNIVAILDTASNGVAITGLTDSANNSYTLVTPGANPSSDSACIAFCISTTGNLPVGSTWKATTSSGQYLLQAVYSVPGIVIVDQKLTFNQTTAATSASLITGPLFGADEIAFGYTMFNSGSPGTLTIPAAFTSLLYNSFNSVAYLTRRGAGTFTYNPSWTSSTPYSSVLVTFSTTAPPGAFMNLTVGITVLEPGGGIV